MPHDTLAYSQIHQWDSEIKFSGKLMTPGSKWILKQLCNPAGDSLVSGRIKFPNSLIIPDIRCSHDVILLNDTLYRMKIMTDSVHITEALLQRAIEEYGEPAQQKKDNVTSTYQWDKAPFKDGHVYRQMKISYDRRKALLTVIFKRSQ